MTARAWASSLRRVHCCLLLALLLLLSLATVASADGGVVASQRPNVVLILADDLGFSDLGCYGGEIDTPQLDRLAAGGVKFGRYRTSPMCVTSRAALLSGMEYHVAGKQAMTRAAPLASVLRDGGYRTIIAGKWHLAGAPTDPHMGFDRFFGFLGGQTNCFTGGPDWVKDGRPFTDYGDDFYATDAFADYALAEMQSARDAGRPYFLFLSFNAPHVPLQAPEADVRKYLDRGDYDGGWMPIRQQRIDRLIKLGLIDADHVFPPPTSDVEPWDLMTKEEQQLETLKQAAYAAMIDRIDQNVGRLLADIEAAGELDNTLVLFTSDNGADFVGIDTNQNAKPWTRRTDHPYERFTGSNGWAYANNAPFRYYKHAGHEGGLAAPLIAHWPSGIQVEAGTLLHQDVRVWDLYPTILQAAGLTYEPCGEQRSLMGEPLQPMFTDAGAPGHDGFISSFIYTRAIIDGHWKATSFSTRPWELYDLAADRTETDDLAAKHPEKLKELLAKWDAFVADAGNVPAAWDPEPGEVVYWMHQRMPPGIASVTPKMSEPAAPREAKLEITFGGDIEFRDEQGVGMNGTIRLMRYGQAEPVWIIDPTPAHQVGPRTLRFHDTPVLEPGRYYLQWDNNVLRLKLGDGPARRLHEQRNAAYGWRFTVRD